MHKCTSGEPHANIRFARFLGEHDEACTRKLLLNLDLYLNLYAYGRHCMI